MHKREESLRRVHLHIPGTTPVIRVLVSRVHGALARVRDADTPLAAVLVFLAPSALGEKAKPETASSDGHQDQD